MRDFLSDSNSFISIIFYDCGNKNRNGSNSSFQILDFDRLWIKKVSGTASDPPTQWIVFTFGGLCAMRSIRKRHGTGFVAINRGAQGVALYKRAKVSDPSST